MFFLVSKVSDEGRAAAGAGLQCGALPEAPSGGQTDRNRRPGKAPPQMATARSSSCLYSSARLPFRSFPLKCQQKTMHKRKSAGSGGK